MRILIVTWVLAAAASLPAQEPGDRSPVLRADIVFAQREDGPLALDLHLPPAGGIPEDVVLILSGPMDAGSGRFRGSPAAREVGAAFAAHGIAAAIPDYRERGFGKDLEAAVGWLREQTGADGRERLRPGVHARGDGVPVALNVCHEKIIEAGALSVAEGCGVVIEGLRPDLPLLVIQGPEDSAVTTAGLRELAYQTVLAGAPLTMHRAAAAECATAAARWHRDRGFALPSVPAETESAARALELARAWSESGDVSRTIGFLKRAWEKGFDRTEEVLLDHGFARVRTKPEFRAFLGERTVARVARTCTEIEPGRRLHFKGRAVDATGKTPIAGARLMFWQTDVRGLYAQEGSDDQARLFAFARTGDDGGFELATIRPAGYPATMIPAHIHVRVEMDGRPPYDLEILFSDDPRLTPDARRYAARARWPIAEIGPDTGGVTEVVIDLPAERPATR